MNTRNRPSLIKLENSLVALFAIIPFILVIASVLYGCGSTKKTLIIRSEPAEAEVCIKGSSESSFFGPQKTCVGQTPFEAYKIEIAGPGGRKEEINFGDIDDKKESFYIILNRKGYASQSISVPAWEQFINLKVENSEEALQKQKNGTVKINSQPAGAMVYVNDAIRGNTPYTYQGLVGAIRVKIEHPGYQVLDKIINVVDDQTQEMNFQLQKQETDNALRTPAQTRASITIQSAPAGALIYVQDILKGNTPYVLEGNPGDSVKIKLEHANFSTLEKMIQLDSQGKSMNLNFSLNPKKTPALKQAEPAQISESKASEKENNANTDTDDEDEDSEPQIQAQN